MLDPAVIAAFQIPPPPTRPQIDEERVWRSPRAADFERVAGRHVAGFEQYAQEWLARIEKRKADLEAMAIPYPMPPEYLAALDAEIGDLEQEADNRALDLGRLRKKIARDTKHMFTVDPSIAAVMRTLGHRLFKADEQIVEGLLGLALYFRALKAEGDPATRGGETFDDPAALRRHLESLTSA